MALPLQIRPASGMLCAAVAIVQDDGDGFTPSSSATAAVTAEAGARARAA